MTTMVPSGPDRRPGALRLHAGPLTAVFEPDTGWLRHLCLGGYELVRAVYGAVRDRHWRTIRPRIQALDTVARERTFDIQFLNRCEEDDIAFAWQAHIRGTAEGACSFRFDGESGSSFLRNRIGLCVLHPIEGCAGRPCLIEHTDGSRTEGSFPELVAPRQPFQSIHRMSWSTDAGRVMVTFEGETFETEDQRNWSDASYKTYGTPLDLPKPVRVSPGDRVQQRVEIAVEPTRTIVAVAEGRVVDLIPDGESQPKPPVGLVMDPSAEPTAAQTTLLRSLAPDHLRVDVRPAHGDQARARLAAAWRLASELGARLHVAALLGDEGPAGLDRLASAARDAGASIDLLLVLGDRGACASPEWVGAARTAFAGGTPQPDVAAGTNRYFAELNRHRPPRDAGAVPAFSLNPQVHAVDDLSVIENLEAQPWIVATVRTFSDRPVAISPITLRPRFVPDAPDRQPIGRDGHAESEDPRQRTLFGAAWTLGSLAQLLPMDHVHSLTYFETIGPRGVLEHDVVFPLYHVLADLAGAGRVRRLRSGVPSRVLGLAIESAPAPRLLVANLADHPSRLRVPVPAASCRIRVLDTRGLRQATTDPAAFRTHADRVTAAGGRLEIELPAYATLHVQWG